MSANTTARDTILAAVHAARPAPVPRPPTREAVTLLLRNRDPSVQRFVSAAQYAGADVIDSDRAFANTAGPNAVVCEGQLGVAENGAVWLPDANIGDRAALLLAEHVLIILKRDQIVDDLHTAYAQLDIARDRFGMFMAGPSKTADIEQALVVGAHGPKRLTILLVPE